MELSDIIERLKGLRRSNKVIVFATGCFDILHEGHEVYLKKAKEQGNVLVVGVECDKNVKFYKGENRPVNAEQHRLKAVSELPMVDFAFVINAKPGGGYRQYLDLVRELKPDIYAFSEMAKKETLKRSEKVLKEIGGKVKIVTPRIKNLSTSIIINKLQSP